MNPLSAAVTRIPGVLTTALKAPCTSPAATLVLTASAMRASSNVGPLIVAKAPWNTALTTTLEVKVAAIRFVTFCAICSGMPARYSVPPRGMPERMNPGAISEPKAPWNAYSMEWLNHRYASPMSPASSAACACAIPAHSAVTTADPPLLPPATRP